MPCVPGTKRPSCPDDLGPLNPGGVGFMERGAPTCHEAGEKGVPESRTQGRMDSGVGLRIVATVDRDVLVRGNRAVRQNIIGHGVSPASHASKPL